jgi:predicted RNA-binding Zn ribbon-like protein
MDGGNSAPGELETVRAFVDTLDLMPVVVEELGDPAQLVAWLHAHGLLAADAGATRSDLARALDLREALRALCVSNAGGPLAADALARVQAAAERAGLGVRFGPQEAALEPRSGGVDGALGRLLAIVARAMADGTWERMKACGDDDCRWVFYDASRNRSGTWCSMASCGNRAKARAYRTRQRAS